MINADLYNMSQVLFDLQKNVIEEEDEETLALGTFGFFNAALSKMISSNIRIAADNSNEVFATKAKYEKDIIMHSITNNISGINAVPAKMPVLFSMLQSGLDDLLAKNNNKAILSDECKITIGDYEYHFQYPIIINKQTIENDQEVYTARYDMTYHNSLSDVTNPFLPSPYIMKRNMYTYVFLYCELIQVERTSDTRKIITDNIIDNKTYQFTFENQLADFKIIVSDDGNTKNVLTPIFEGADIPNNVVKYCWYSYMDSKTIRVKFDKSVYMPTTNSDIETVVYTTHGAECNFEYRNDFVFTLEDTDNYVYNNLEVYLVPQGNSENGADKKSISELKRILPKQTQSRGNIISDDDITNYFSLYNSDSIKVTNKRKVYNQFMNAFYLYFMCKDSDGVIIPTNTISINLDPNKAVVYETNTDSKQYIYNQGTVIGYNRGSRGEIIDDFSEENLSKYKFIYMLPYRAVINTDGPLVSYYMDNAYKEYKSYYKYINGNAPLQFICPYFILQKSNESNSYTLTFELDQNIESDVGVIENNLIQENEYNQEQLLYMDDEDKDEDNQEPEIITDLSNITNNSMVIAVAYSSKDGAPYRYFVGELQSYTNKNSYSYLYQIKFTTDNIIDNENNIKFINGHMVNSDINAEPSYGFISGQNKINIYILNKFKDSEGNVVNYGLNDLNSIVSGIDEYTCTNVFTVVEEEGISFFENFTEITNSTVDVLDDNAFILKDVPVVGNHYSKNQNKLVEFFNTIKEYKGYIDDILPILIKPFTIDFKFYNTYGPSYKYHVNSEKTHELDRTNITLNFELKLKKSSDNYTKNYIIRDIQAAIESFDRDPDIYIPNIVADIYNRYQNSIYYISFAGVDEYDATNQSFITTTSEGYDNTVPEFICINKLDDGTPDINIKLI